MLKILSNTTIFREIILAMNGSFSGCISFKRSFMSEKLHDQHIRCDLRNYNFGFHYDHDFHMIH